jgi:hypothetical protein
VAIDWFVSGPSICCFATYIRPCEALTSTSSIPDGDLQAGLACLNVAVQVLVFVTSITPKLKPG